jgi:hypothetical protein
VNIALFDTKAAAAGVALFAAIVLIGTRMIRNR